MTRKRSVVITLILILAAFLIFSLQKNNESEPVIVFKDNIKIVLGQSTYHEGDSHESRIDEVFPQVRPQDIIVNEDSVFDEISFNRIIEDTLPIEKDNSSLNSFKLGEHEGTLFARKGNKISKFEFSYTVIEAYEI
ncbi:MAG: hypothetical protein RR565_08390 [Erysipelothrix sp.]